MQVNTSLTDLNLYGNDLGPEGGKAIAKSLEVDLPIFNVTSLSVTTEVIFYFHLIMQVNTTLTNLDLRQNNLGPEGGKALAVCLEVIFPFRRQRALMTLNMCVLFSRACCFFMQGNETLTSLNLYYNDLGPEGGKAVAKCLEVTLSTSLSSLSLMTLKAHLFVLGEHVFDFAKS
jgi:Ran GTPase-activating protein (RanGAP) involved in mRNA processing and transport